MVEHDEWHVATGDELRARTPAQQLAAVALGGTPVTGESEAALALLLSGDRELKVRIAAAHALFRLSRVPADAHRALAELLVDEDSAARQVAQAALTKAEPSAASAVAQVVGETPAERWTTELLGTLAAFTRGTDAQRKIEAWLMGVLAQAPLLPTGVAGYTALAGMAAGGVGLDALSTVVCESEDAEIRKTALAALGNLGALATPCAARLASLLQNDNDPDFELLLCQTLVKMRAPASALPLPTLIERVQLAAPRLAAAHAMLITLGGKTFARAADALRARHAAGPELLRAPMDQAHQVLTGNALAPVQP
jgi:hypothetical protein